MPTERTGILLVLKVGTELYMVFLWLAARKRGVVNRHTMGIFQITGRRLQSKGCCKWKIDNK